MEKPEDKKYSQRDPARICESGVQRKLKEKEGRDKMKTIKTLRESTNYWKGVPIGTVIAATLFWTCVKIAKALKDFHGEE